MLNPVRKKGPERLVTKPTKMTLLIALGSKISRECMRWRPQSCW